MAQVWGALFAVAMLIWLVQYLTKKKRSLWWMALLLLGPLAFLVFLMLEDRSRSPETEGT